MAQAEAERSTARVYQYPTRRRRPIRQPKGAMVRENWPANVQSILPPPRPKAVIPPSGFVVLALVKANAKKRVRKGGAPPLPACLMDVHHELSAMLKHLKASGDIEAAASAFAAMEILWAGRTGRW